MPATNVIFYKEDDATVPALDWIDRLPAKAQDKCQARLQRLADSGHELRRPIADLLRDGIHELRFVQQGVNYRILYFFHGQTVAVVSHGLAKERKVPSKEINRAIERKRKFEAEPRKHTHEEA
ncbi:MAG: type II toxin-antitoxin system RelE/ParE family toxin [Planctomycetes bacterium]|nr:type II toxin-antitoxin system RelE/ParE family toxin [Planctomycetota bacterium]